jgi:transcriptional regulator with XRE-family HTH domain
MQNNVHSPAMKFQDLLRSTRLKAKLTYNKASARTGYTIRALCYWEKGERVPHPTVQQTVLKKLKAR